MEKTEKDIKTVLIREITDIQKKAINYIMKISGKGSASKALLYAAVEHARLVQKHEELEKEHRELKEVSSELLRNVLKRKDAETNINKGSTKLKKVLGSSFHYYG